MSRFALLFVCVVCVATLLLATSSEAQAHGGISVTAYYAGPPAYGYAPVRYGWYGRRVMYGPVVAAPYYAPAPVVVAPIVPVPPVAVYAPVRRPVVTFYPPAPPFFFGW